MIYSINYTEKVPNGHAGAARLWQIFINPKYRDDEGLTEHEKTHVWQFWRTCGLYIFLMHINWFLLRWEVEAYRNQLKYPPATTGDIDEYRKIYAGFLADPNMYGFKISQAEAYELLK